MTASPGIPVHALLACEPFGMRLLAGAVARALAAGLGEAGRPEPLVRKLPAALHGAQARLLLDETGFDSDMRSARFVMLAVPELSERTLAASMAFEIASRARQAGVPCCAVAARNELDAFDARVLDLQVVLTAGSPRSLRAAGAKLAAVM